MRAQPINQVATYIASDLMLYKHTKHIEVDCHFIREVVMRGDVITSYDRSSLETYSLRLFSKKLFLSFYSMLGIEVFYDIA